MTRRPAVLVIALTVAALTGWGLTGPVAQAAVATVTDVTVIGDDYVGGHGANVYTSPAQRIQMSGTPSSLAVSVESGSWVFQLEAPLGTQLHKGVYREAEYAGEQHPGYAGFLVSHLTDCRGRGITADFTVRDIGVDTAGTVNRLWVTFVSGCDDSWGQMMGELRVNEPVASSDLTVHQAAVDWPVTYPHVAGRTVPVWVENTSGASMHIAASLAGANASDYSIVSNGCANLLTLGASCAVQLRFLPGLAGPSAASLELSDPASGAHFTVPVGGTATATKSDLVTTSDTPLVPHATHEFLVTNSPIRGTGTPTSSWFTADDAFGLTGVAFYAPIGQVFQPGRTYSGAVDGYFPQTAPALRVMSYNEDVCYGSPREFTVLEATFKDGTGPLRSFAATFVLDCGGNALVRGWIAYHATRTYAPSVLTAPTPTTHPRSTPLTVAGSLRTAGEPIAGATVTVKKIDPAGASQLAPVVTDAAGNFTIHDTPTVGGATSYVLVYAGDATHDPVTRTIDVYVARLPTILTLAVNGRVFVYGGLATVSLHLGPTQALRTVAIWEYVYGVPNPRQTLVRRVTLDANGNYTFTINMYRHISFTAIYDGDTFNEPATASTYTTALARITPSLGGAYLTSRGVWYFHRTTNPVISGLISPARGAFGLMNVTLEAYTNGVWAEVGGAAFLPISAANTVVTTLTGSHRVGVPYRTRIFTSSDSVNAASTSAWLPFQFTT